MAKPVDQRERMEPEEIRKVLRETTEGDAIVFNDNVKPLDVVDIDNHQIKAEGPQGGTKLFLPDPVGNTKSGDDTPQWRTNKTQPQWLWFFEIL